MGGQLLKLGLLLLSMAYSSSMDPKTRFATEMESDSAETSLIPTMNSLLAAVNENTPNDKVSTLIDTGDKGLMTSHGGSKESKVTTKQETSTAVETTQEETSTYKADAMTIGSNTSGPLVAALNVNTPSDKDTTLIDTSTKEPIMSSTSTKESKTTPEQETNQTFEEETNSVVNAMMTIGSTTSKDPSSATFGTRPAIERITISAGLPFTNQDNTTNDYEMTSSSQPSGETGTSKSLFTQDPNNNQTPKNPEEISNNAMKRKILIVVIIVILFLILVTIVVILVRSKRRRGSQNLSRNSSKRQDVWAGQVPELGEVKVTQYPMGVKNGTAGNKPEPGQEQEMITFISAEKKDDSLVEVNELGKEDTSEKKPLLEDTSQVNEEPLKPPVQEQIPSPTVE